MNWVKTHVPLVVLVVALNLSSPSFLTAASPGEEGEHWTTLQFRADVDYGSSGIIRINPCSGKVEPSELRSGHWARNDLHFSPAGDLAGSLKGTLEVWRDKNDKGAGWVRYTFDAAFDVSEYGFAGPATGYWEIEEDGGPVQRYTFVRVELGSAVSCPDQALKTPKIESPPGTTPTREAVGGSGLLTNGDFSAGVSGWTISETGYGSMGAQRPQASLPPNTGGGCLALGVYGGYQSVHQDVAVDGVNLRLRSRFRIDQWSTFGGGRLGGWASVGVSYMSGDRILGTVHYYLNPHGSSVSDSTVAWVKLGEGRELPTGWYDVDVNLMDEATRHFGWNPASVDRVRIAANIFGTHEDQTYTKACFDDFTLTVEGTRVGGARVVNGDFAECTKGWTLVESGYAGSPTPQAALPTNCDSGCLKLSVSGGTRSAYQDIDVTGLDLRFRARYRIETWSTFGGQNGGWAAAAVQFRNSGGNTLGTVYYYVNPYGTSNSSSTVQWVKLGEGQPTPTDWIEVDADLRQAATDFFGLVPGEVTSVRLFAVAFGTHEDQTYTAVCFDDFALEVR